MTEKLKRFCNNFLNVKYFFFVSDFSKYTYVYILYVSIYDILYVKRIAKKSF